MCSATCGLGAEQHAFTASSFLWPKASHMAKATVQGRRYGRRKVVSREGKGGTILGQIIQSVMVKESLSPQQCDSIVECREL